MSRLIDADKLIERINGTGYAEQIKSNLQFMVDMQPTIDAVEVVRCENCRHDNNCEIQYAAQAGSKFFCAYGERKNDDDVI